MNESGIVNLNKIFRKLHLHDMSVKIRFICYFMGSFGFSSSSSMFINILMVMELSSINTK